MCIAEIQPECIRFVEGKSELVGKDHCPDGECKVELTIGTVFNVHRCAKCGCEEWL